MNGNPAIEKIASLPMEGEPGKIFRYSNTGLQIAGAAIEKISGKSFEQLFAERIAKPLGMKNSDFGKGKVALPAGGAFSTPDDYTNFLVMILNKGMFNGKRILTEKSVELLAPLILSQPGFVACDILTDQRVDYDLDYFRKYPGRFQSAHLADWSKAKDVQVPIGQGDVDWKDFFEAAKTGGVQNIFVEMDPETFGPSAKFLLNL